MPADYKERKYNVVSYDPKWKDMFKKEAQILSFIFGTSAIAIEHIGSTAVPGLAGKPIIDILIIVDDIAIANTINRQMESADYQAFGGYVMPDARLFIKGTDDIRPCNVHVFKKEHPHVKEMLRLRDYFRAHPEAVKEYSRLKLDLFKKYPHDYGQYRKEKDAWMKKIQDRVGTENEIECVITGRVQTVMFRDFACRRARRLGISGTVQNLPDGSVRVVAQGSEEKMIKYIELLKKGPLLAKVKNIQVAWQEAGESFDGFKIVY